MILGTVTKKAVEEGDVLGMWVAIGGLLALAVLGALLIHTVRRWYLRQHEQQSETFTLNDLRRMRNEGELTQEEYERMRTILLGIPPAHANSSAPESSDESQ